MRVLVAILLLAAGTLAPLELSPPDMAAGEVWILYDGDVEGALEAIQRHDLIHYPLANLGMVIVKADAASIAQLRSAFGVQAIPDWTEELHLDESVAYIQADLVRSAVGVNRNGATVLVVDTGVSSLHPDFLNGNLVANIKPQLIGGVIADVLDAVPVIDLAGHGTHVAGIVAGSGNALGVLDPRYGKYEGVYSNGAVASFQAVSDDDPEATSGQAVLAAFDWAIENRDIHNLRVVTNSWGSEGNLDPDGPIGRATKALYRAGMTVIFSAGNVGEEGSLNRHCMVPWVLCVTAGDLEGNIADFSSRGDSNNPWAHPDITAPGVSIRASAALEDVPSTVGIATGASEPLYTDRSGTSMAAPHVAGVAGQLQAINPNLSPDQVMDIIVATARPMPDDETVAGAGYIVATAAATLASQTTGNRADFLAGRDVKYAGPTTGDQNFSVDPLSSTVDQRGTYVATDSSEWWQANWVIPVGSALSGGLIVGLIAAIIVIARR